MIMNSTNRIMKKLSAIELESHDVELSLADDVKAVISGMTKSYQDVQSSLQKYNAAADVVEKASTSLANGAESVIANIEKLEKAAKDLGIDSPTEFNAQKNQAKMWLKQASALRLKPLKQTLS